MNIFSRVWKDIISYSSLEQEEKLDYKSMNVSCAVPVVETKEQLDEILECKRLMGKGSGINYETLTNCEIGFQMSKDQLNEIFKVKKLMRK